MAHPTPSPVSACDEIDDTVDWWCSRVSDIDPSVKKLSMRMRRVAHLYERVLRKELAALDCDVWEFEVLMHIMRAPGGCRSAGELQRSGQVTSGAISNRLARLEQRGWVRRDVDPKDRRQVLVTLTGEGDAQARRLIAAKTSTESAVFGRLDPAQRATLDDGLRHLMAILEEAGAGC